MTWLTWVLVLAAFAGGAYWGARRERRPHRAPGPGQAGSHDPGSRRSDASTPDAEADRPTQPPPPALPPGAQAAAPAPEGAAAADGGTGAPSLDDLVERLDEPYEASGRHPTEVTGLADFKAALAILADVQRTPLDRVVEGACGSNSVLAMLAAEALVVRDDAAPATAKVLEELTGARVWTLYGLLRFLARRADRPVIWEVLLQAPEYWADNALMPAFMAEFAAARLAQGEPADPSAALAHRPDTLLSHARALLAKMKGEAASQLRAALDQWDRTRVDAKFLREIGRLWSGTVAGPAAGATASAAADEAVVAHPALEQGTKAVLDELTATPPKSVVLAGEPGVGKSSIARRAAAVLIERGWTIFEAGAADLLAGQTYMGELEKRMRELLEQIDAARKVVWLIPAFHELAFAGRHRYSTTSVLDMVMSAVESGRIVVLGESAPTPMESLVKQRPRLRFSLAILKVEPLDAEATLALAREVIAREIVVREVASPEAVARDGAAAGHRGAAHDAPAGTAPKPAGLVADPDVAADALELARNYLTASALPGSVVDLLRQTRQRVLAAGGQRLTRDEVLGTVAAVTGLPRSVLDERAGLEPASLRDHFARRVMGQPEAVSCLVDRVAMLKAGLVDPRRPIGVFLFAGPTGTGKTEVAKTLATFLFGSAERMLRLDMSEFQEPSALARLVGEAGDDGTVESLVQHIRKQPFAVVLLDEFEKAHPRVWDLFLQVFDDGRLTDASGQVADFRHAIIILTSNVGATTHHSSSLGFTQGGAAFSEAQVTRALAGLFRPEFINRIDRVVVFRPLTKAVMRDILKKELGDVVKRRGFRNRDWAVEWEPSAIDFLLERGFTPDMGARPLRRAIEEHLLAPLAMTIVEHRFPEGDQFLFVRSDGRGIQVEFIDPDGPAEGTGTGTGEGRGGTAGTGGEVAAGTGSAEGDMLAGSTPSGLSLGRLALAPRADDEARQFLVARMAALAERLASEAWHAEKDALLAAINRDGFWSDGDRFETLDRMERMDRIAAEADGLQSLARRLASGRAPAASVVAGVAQRLHLLNAALADLDARRPGDAFVAIDVVASEEGQAQVADWARRVGRMYREWARRRGLHLEALHEGTDGGTVFAVSGLGAHALLGSEVGLHVLEVPDHREGFDRAAARVRVAGQPVAPAPRTQRERDVALQCLAAAALTSNVVRRYREEPSPLVRDAVAGWRTGRLADVLGGSFDLFGPA